MVVKSPPIATIPSVRVPRAYTVLLAFGLRVRSRTHVDEYLAIRLRTVAHQTVVNVHQNMIFPLLSMRIVYTTGVHQVTLGSNVASRIQRVLTRAILLRATQPTRVNCQPNTIDPSVWSLIFHIAAAVRTGLKVASRTQSAETRAILVLAAHHIVVNVHPRRILPSDCIAIV